jgi:hypothetical protein
MQRLLDELNDNAAKMWIPGKWISIDEQTLGFQGRSGLKLKISYKKEGDGFQCDSTQSTKLNWRRALTWIAILAVNTP